MTEHERLTQQIRHTDPYVAYVARCHSEDLDPLSRAAWESVRQPLTQRSMWDAWQSIFRRKPKWWRGSKAA